MCSFNGGIKGNVLYCSICKTCSAVPVCEHTVHVVQTTHTLEAILLLCAWQSQIDKILSGVSTGGQDNIIVINVSAFASHIENRIQAFRSIEARFPDWIVMKTTIFETNKQKNANIKRMIHVI